MFDQKEKDDTINPYPHGAPFFDVRLRKVQIASAMFIFSIIAGLDCNAVLYPSFEKDATLAWSDGTTSLANTLFATMEVAGLLSAGPLADHIRPTTLIAIECMLVGMAMLCVCLSRGSHVILVSMAIPAFGRGVVWPSLGAIISANLPHALQDEVFLTTALGSRLGDVASNLLIGFLMQRMGWDWHRSMSGQMIMVASIMLCAFAMCPRDLQAPQDKNLSMAGQWKKAKELVTSLDGWLAFLTLAGTYFAWALYSYLPVILVDTYNLDPGSAASAASSFPIGCVMGLVIGAISTNQLGIRQGRYLHVIQSCVGVCAAMMLTVFDVSLTQALMLLGLMGFGFVVSTYVPYMIYAANSHASERAFRLAILDGFAAVVFVLITALYGRLRTNSPSGADGQVGHVLYGITAFGLTLATLSMVGLYSRLPSTSALNEGSRLLGDASQGSTNNIDSEGKP